MNIFKKIFYRPTEKNDCYTYFVIKGDFNTHEVSKILQLRPSKSWNAGDKRRNGSVYDFSLWEFGRCTEYSVDVEEQILKTIFSLRPKVDQLKQIKEKYNVRFFLEIVPSIHQEYNTPAISFNSDIVEFCYLSGTEIDIDMYIYYD